MLLPDNARNQFGKRIGLRERAYFALELRNLGDYPKFYWRRGDDVYVRKFRDVDKDTPWLHQPRYYTHSAAHLHRHGVLAGVRKNNTITGRYDTQPRESEGDCNLTPYFICQYRRF